ncbi:hypothetical protein ACQP00_19630 [Dactylosporangium sp. CS-047395]|uniref:hypothetical protein n=1 Tax=Dactylosporangium sp. CS-047395 TaxID=3239936 RepID=UPI003D8AEC49
MGFIGCSMVEKITQDSVTDGDIRMWGPYGTSGLIMESWTDPNFSASRLFDQQVARYGRREPGTASIQEEAGSRYRGSVARVSSIFAAEQPGWPVHLAA